MLFNFVHCIILLNFKNMFYPTVMAALGTPEILVILVVVLLLFGGKKIPELMKGLGQGVREFKDGQKGDE